MLRTTRRNGVLAMAILGCATAACSPGVAATDETQAPSSSGAQVSTGSTANDTDVSGPTSGVSGSSSGAGSTSADSATGSSSTGLVFPDPCDPFAQDCPDGYKCNPFANDGGNSWNDTTCVPVDAQPDGYGDPCVARGSGVSGFDSCDVGAMCLVGGAETLEGQCVELCGGSPSEPACVQKDAFCRISADGAFNPCFVSCDPLGEDCDAAQTCVAVDGGRFTCVPEGGGGQYAEACRVLNDCANGLGCFQPAESVCDVGEAGCCLPYCDLQAPDCPDALACLPFFEEPVPRGYEDLGLCSEPE